MSNKLVKEKRVDQADLAWLTDPEVYEVNTIPPHSDHESFQSQEELEEGKSSLVQSLDGNWLIDYAENGQGPVNFYAEDFDDSNFKSVKVPGNLELQGFGQPQYVNIQYPWDGSEEIFPPQVPNKNPLASYVRYFVLDEAFWDKEVSLKFAGAATSHLCLAERTLRRLRGRLLYPKRVYGYQVSQEGK